MILLCVYAKFRMIYFQMIFEESFNTILFIKVLQYKMQTNLMLCSKIKKVKEMPLGFALRVTLGDLQ